MSELTLSPTSVGAVETSAPAARIPAPKRPPSAWAKQKATPAWLLAGAYFAQRWERDGDLNDLSLVSEIDFDAACAAVGSIQINASPHPRR